MKLAILGNSHVACMLQAARDHPELLGKDIDPTFFACAARGMRHMQVSDGRLLPGDDGLKEHMRLSSGGRESVDVAEYDAFLLVGMRYRIRHIPGSCSIAVLRRALRGQIADSEMWPLVDKLRTLTDRPVFCGHHPLPVARDSDADLVGYDDMIALLEEEVEDRDVTLVRQPVETRTDDLCTDIQFARGSRKLVSGKEHGSHDLSHMNADYGGIYLDAFRTTLLPDTGGQRDLRESRRLETGT